LFHAARLFSFPHREQKVQLRPHMGGKSLPIHSIDLIMPHRMHALCFQNRRGRAPAHNAKLPVKWNGRPAPDWINESRVCQCEMHTYTIASSKFCVRHNGECHRTTFSRARTHIECVCEIFVGYFFFFTHLRRLLMTISCPAYKKKIRGHWFLVQG
jgi:hypothetical protein